ncbi:MAG TPA: prolyl oligopeptidase family serine peptidase [Acidimicrobiales bacterium]|nr:prolyl oligopeptidase family serine peptidase [Acidimicrobiales bacterium]
MAYPPALRLDLVDDVHGRPVADPYRWLEDAGSPDTEAWSAAQDRLAREHLDALPGREHLRARLHELLSAGLVTVPVVRGGRAFFQRRAPAQEHPVLLVREPEGGERVLVDPSALSDDDSVTLDGWAPSPDGRLLAYLLSEGGDEESALRVLDVGDGAVVDGPIDRTRYTPVAWTPEGDAYYYVRRLPPGDVPAGEEQFHRRVYRHRLGVPAGDDELVFGEGRDRTEYYGLDLSPDGRWLVVSASKGTAPRNDVYLADLDTGTWAVVQEAVDAWTDAAVHHDGRLYLRTNAGAPRYRLAVAEPGRPTEWRDLVPESEAVLDGYAVTAGAVVVATSRHAVAGVAVHDRETGGYRLDVALPGLGSVNGPTARLDGGHEVWLGYSDFLRPPSTHRLDLVGGALEVWEDAPGRVEVTGVAASQVAFESADGTEVRMFVLGPAEGGGPRPTILYGYGGFDISLTPQYSAGILAWVEQGGVYAVANLRGGGEEGEEWHRAGMRERKQNVFDDAAAAGRWLVASGTTGAGQLGVSGGSNGGLLVGALVVQQPELVAAAVCSAPLLDMVRYERFGLGVTWNDEYGTVDDPVEAGWLLSYSPYHHVVPGVRYPAVLFTVFDADTRVDPLHARKMCAALQHATAAPPRERPVLLRREQKVGHAARSVGRSMELGVDTAAFLAAQLGLALPGAV